MKQILLVVTGLAVCMAACMKKPDSVYNHYVSQERIIKSFNVGEQQVGNAVINLNGDSATVRVTVKQGTDLSSVTPVIVVSPKATISPASGETVDFAAHGNKYTYVVTSAAGVKMKWTVLIKYDYGLRLIPNTGDWDPNVRVYSDSDYNAYLTTYTGWNGGDGCTSILLPDGDILWTFQDSFIGVIDSNRNRDPAKNTFVRNAAFLQKNRSLSSHVLLNPTGLDGKPATWITVPGVADGNKDLYWEGYSQVVGSKLQMLMGHMHLDDQGNYVHQSTDVAVFSLPDMHLDKIVSANAKNLAFQKTAYASSTSTDASGAGAVTDGDAGTRWSSNYSDNEWIYIDLGSSMLVDSVSLTWEAAYATSYKIQVSDDAQNWTDVYTNTNGQGGTEGIKFTPVQSRYVRMLGVQRVSTPFGKFGYSLYEFGVYNSANSGGTYAGGLAFESGFFAPDGYTYIYASDNFGLCASHVYVARVASHDLTGQWQYYTKAGWVSTPPANHDDFIDICTSNVTQPNVFEEGGKYYMVSQTTCYGLDINIWESNNPVGPFTNRRTLYKIPDRYTMNSAELPHFITYNAFVHHSLSREGELVISYNINPVGFENNFNGPGTADNYRPHFVRVFNWKD